MREPLHGALTEIFLPPRTLGEPRDGALSANFFATLGAPHEGALSEKLYPPQKVSANPQPQYRHNGLASDERNP